MEEASHNSWPPTESGRYLSVSAELLAEEIVRLRVARQTIHKVQDYSICFEKVYPLLQTFIATVRYTLQIVKENPTSDRSLLLSGCPQGWNCPRGAVPSHDPTLVQE